MRQDWAILLIRPNRNLIIINAENNVAWKSSMLAKEPSACFCKDLPNMGSQMFLRISTRRFSSGVPCVQQKTLRGAHC